MRLIVSDDHDLFREALTTALPRLGHEVVADTGVLAEVPLLVARHHPEVCLLDLWFGLELSLDVARRVHRANPDVHIVLLTADVAPEATAALEEGVVRGIAHKSWHLTVVEQMLVRLAQRKPVRHLVPLPAAPAEIRGPALTHREMEVLQLIAEGASTTDVRQQLGVSEHTVRTHVRNVLGKLGAHNRVEAVSRAHDQGLISSGRR
jgi:two-component system, NarL family, nitrate/nitrite response regulator NarL